MKEKSKRTLLKIKTIIFMTTLLMCCKTHQSAIEKSTTIATDTTTITRVAVKDSTSLNAKIDSIIIEEYAVDDRSEQTTENHNNPGRKVRSYQKRNDISQKEKGSIKKTKIYGVSLSNSWLSINDSLYKKMTHQATTKSEIKQKNPIQTTAGNKIIYVIIGITLLLFVGYLNWKNAVQ